MTEWESFIYLKWIGNSEMEDQVLNQVKEGIERTFGVPVRIQRGEEAPRSAFDPARGQCSSTKILRWMLDDVPADARKILAITDADLYIPVLTFVFGEAQLGGKGAVVSTARFRMGLDGSPTPRHLFQASILKECVHELGHTFGLTHCPSSRCVMSRSHTVLDVDTKSGQLCRDCRSLLRELQRKEG